MSPRVKLKWIAVMAPVFMALFVVQLTLYIVNAAAGNEAQCMLVTYIEGGLILGYTLARAIWRIAAQVYLSKKWLKHFRSIQDTKLSKRLAYKYRSLGTEIVVVRDESFVALAIGMRRPAIVVSTAVLHMFDDKEVNAIILHEWHHCLNRDNAKLFLIKLQAEAFGYLPIMRAIFRYCQTWTELAADRFAMRRMGTALPLASVLLKLSKLSRGRLHSAALHFTTATMDYRIAQVLEPDKPIKVKVAWRRPLMISVMLLLLLLLSGDS
ncbi:M56 family metallopeptidase [Paenibacillus sp. MMS18-CY102]|uniref:M56 family metallopeptidase n=1 Tax=Paenibacillus sp. MMS18-CY102 TaxID=2682849 RepID=UPI00136676C1|nr:M56 family metallopeptidase [Paenibacillus sp. MMS18-CY102]MWC29220.1 M48 family metalloprotease [Paenibacillus sp. MMS18-CY102]